MVMQDVEEHPRYNLRHFFQVQFPLPALAPPASTIAPTKELGYVKVPDDEARSWRITLQPMSFSPGRPPDTLDLGAVEGDFGDIAACVLEWGSENVRHSAEVDWNMGCSFVLHGSDVRLSVRPPARMNAGGTSDAKVVIFACSIVPDHGGRVPNSPPKRTIYTGSINADNGESGPLPIPAFARRMRWVRVSDSDPTLSQAGTDVDFFWLQSPVVGIGFDRTKTGSLNWPGGIGIPVPAMSRFVDVFNNAPAEAAQMSLWLEFDLDLG